jgi:hypothetical protein
MGKDEREKQKRWPWAVADPEEKSTCGKLYILLICVTGTIIYKK